MNRPLTALTSLCLVLIVNAPSTLAQATDADKSLEQRREEARVERLWNLNWRTFTPSFLEHEGEFICVHGYNKRNPSSLGQSVSQYRSESTLTQAYTDERGRDASRKLTKPEEDAFAAVGLIPHVAVGQYGYIHSGLIESIVDDKTVELENIWLVDAEAVRDEKQKLKEELWGEVIEDIRDAIEGRRNRRDTIRDRREMENDAIDWGFKSREEAADRQRAQVYSRYKWVVKGYATGKLKEDARWPSENAKEPGLQLIIVKIEDRTVTAVPAATLRTGITELQFIDYLRSREITKAQFMEVVNQAKSEHRGDYVAHALAQLTGQSLPSNREKEEVNNEVELAD
eukprot:g13408.t1